MTADRLFRDLVDDAGVFPPTSLPMRDALARHVADRRAGHPVLTHRFLCPASRLDDLRRHDPGPIRVGVIADAGEPPDLSGLNVDLVEVRLPPPSERAVPSPRGTAISPARVAPWVPASARLFVEVPPNSLPVDVAAGTGLKVRCGGLTPDAFPGTRDLGAFIRFCVRAGVPFKATAGLHHAVRHHDPSFGVYRHGFLNLVLAVCAAVEGRDPVPVLEIGEPGELVRLARAVPDATAERARSLLVSYGSCATAIPLADLAALGLIPGARQTARPT